MEDNRDKNRKLLKQKTSLIIKQIRAAKSKVLKYLDDVEERLLTFILKDGGILDPTDDKSIT
jgi:hypothetical protein